MDNKKVQHDETCVRPVNIKEVAINKSATSLTLTEHTGSKEGKKTLTFGQLGDDDNFVR